MAVITVPDPVVVPVWGLAPASWALQVISPGGQADTQTENFWRSLPESPPHLFHEPLLSLCGPVSPRRARR